MCGREDNSLKCVCAELIQSCLILCSLMDLSPPGFSVHGILQARILDWVSCALPPPGDLPNPRIEPTSLTSTCTGRQILYPLSHPGSQLLVDG